QLRAALPAPPYTISSCQRSATSGSRLFMSMRRAASCGQPLHESALPRGARMGSLGGPSGELSFIVRRGMSTVLVGPRGRGHLTVPGRIAQREVAIGSSELPHDA